MSVEAIWDRYKEAVEVAMIPAMLAKKSNILEALSRCVPSNPETWNVHEQFTTSFHSNLEEFRNLGRKAINDQQQIEELKRTVKPWGYVDCKKKYYTYQNGQRVYKENLTSLVWKMEAQCIRDVIEFLERLPRDQYLGGYVQSCLNQARQALRQKENEEAINDAKEQQLRELERQQQQNLETVKTLEDGVKKKAGEVNRQQKKWEKYKNIVQSANQGGLSASPSSKSSSSPSSASNSTAKNSKTLNKMQQREEIRKKLLLKKQVKEVQEILGGDAPLSDNEISSILEKTPEIKKELQKLKDKKFRPGYLKYRLEYILHCCDIANRCDVKSLLGPGYAPIDRASILADLASLPDDPEQWTAHHGFQDKIRNWNLALTGPEEGEGIPYSDPKHPGRLASDAAENAYVAYHGRRAEFG